MNQEVRTLLLQVFLERQNNGMHMLMKPVGHMMNGEERLMEAICHIQIVTVDQCIQLERRRVGLDRVC